MDKFQNKYRIPSARLQTWDYASKGSYFITICTKNREHYFGEIVDGISGFEMQLNAIGELAEQFWVEIPIHFPFITLGNFVVMPNHIHGILIIADKNIVDDNDIVETLPDTTNVEMLPIVETLQCNVSSGETMNTTNPDKNEQMSKISPKSGTISTIIRSYKSVVTKNVGLLPKTNFKWQPLFHDHIIRDAESFERIQNYIANNPRNWKDDKFYGK